MSDLARARRFALSQRVRGCACALRRPRTFAAVTTEGARLLAFVAPDAGPGDIQIAGPT